VVYEEIEIGDFMITQITELQAVAQSGLAYCKDKFDIERYKRILEIIKTISQIIIIINDNFSDLGCCKNSNNNNSNYYY
jgi:hypothetical protein